MYIHLEAQPEVSPGFCVPVQAKGGTEDTGVTLMSS